MQGRGGKGVLTAQDRVDPRQAWSVRWWSRRTTSCSPSPPAAGVIRTVAGGASGGPQRQTMGVRLMTCPTGRDRAPSPATPRAADEPDADDAARRTRRRRERPSGSAGAAARVRCTRTGRASGAGARRGGEPGFDRTVAAGSCREDRGLPLLGATRRPGAGRTVRRRRVQPRPRRVPSRRGGCTERRRAETAPAATAGQAGQGRSQARRARLRCSQRRPVVGPQVVAACSGCLLRRRCWSRSRCCGPCSTRPASSTRSPSSTSTTTDNSAAASRSGVVHFGRVMLIAALLGVLNVIAVHPAVDPRCAALQPLLRLRRRHRGHA